MARKFTRGAGSSPRVRILINEQDLLLQAQKGDQTAATALIERYIPLISKAAHQTHLLPIADEAMAEGQLELLLAIRRYDMTSGIPFAGYAKAMVYGRMWTLFKQSRRHWEHEVLTGNTENDGEGGDFWNTVADGHDDMGSFVDHKFLVTALKELPTRQREVIYYLYYEGLTQQETAARLQISQQAVAKLKSKALKAMRNSECLIRN